MKTTMKRPLMTLSAVAVLVGVTRHSIRAWVKRGRSPCKLSSPHDGASVRVGPPVFGEEAATRHFEDNDRSELRKSEV
jgi:hypothetical protein